MSQSGDKGLLAHAGRPCHRGAARYGRVPPMTCLPASGTTSNTQQHAPCSVRLHGVQALWRTRNPQLFRWPLPHWPGPCHWRVEHWTLRGNPQYGKCLCFTLCVHARSLRAVARSSDCRLDSTLSELAPSRGRALASVQYMYMLQCACCTHVQCAWVCTHNDVHRHE